MSGKWGRKYWQDLGERVGSSAIGGVLTMLSLQYTDLVSSSVEAWTVAVGIPAATSLCKGLLANMKGSAGSPDGGSASLIGDTPPQA